MPRERTTPPTTSSVRQLATRRGYLLTRADRPRRFKLFCVSGRTAPVQAEDAKQLYSWRLADADAWLRKRPLLKDQ